MLPFIRSTYSYSIYAVISLSILLLVGCRDDGKKNPVEMEPAGEPEKYSATVVRIIDDGAKREITTTHQVRSGEQRREEWTEGNHTKVLILRPADGKGFLLDLDARTYVELDFDESAIRIVQSGRALSNASAATSENIETPDTAPLGIDHYFEDTQLPTSRETVSLPSVMIDGHRCSAFEARVTYPDGHIEKTRKYQAPDLSGLLLRVESESDRSNIKMVTERRNVRLEVSIDAFTIPADFKKDERPLR
jgi:hypothetical protein